MAGIQGSTSESINFGTRHPSAEATLLYTITHLKPSGDVQIECADYSRMQPPNAHGYVGPHTETTLLAGVDVAPLWEPYPAFGDYASIIREERGFPLARKLIADEAARFREIMRTTPDVKPHDPFAPRPAPASPETDSGAYPDTPKA
jgi:hypothetical protein